MGISLASSGVVNSSMIKSVILTTLAPVGAVAHHPVVKSVVVAPAEVNHEVTAHALPVAVGYHGYGYGHGFAYGKREADAAVLDGHTKVLTAPTPLIHNPPVLPIAPVAPLAHAAYGLGYGYAGLPLGHGIGYGHGLAYGKREADAAILDGHTKVLTAPTPL